MPWDRIRWLVGRQDLPFWYRGDMGGDMLVVVVGSDRGRDDGSLVASVAMADTGERASHSMGCVEVALRAGQGSQGGADKQDRLETHKIIFKFDERHT